MNGNATDPTEKRLSNRQREALPHIAAADSIAEGARMETSTAPPSTGGWRTTTSAPSSAASEPKWPISPRPRCRDKCSRPPPSSTRASKAISPPYSSGPPLGAANLALKVRYGLNLERRLNRIDDALSMLRKESAGPGW